MNEKELPVRIVKTEPHAKGRVPGGGSPKELFETEDEFLQRQKSFMQRVDYVKKYFLESFKKYPDVPHVSKVQLVEKAIAKSHRPTFIFSTNTCPIIGVGELGQLFVRTEEERLHYLKARLSKNHQRKHQGKNGDRI
jgi:serine protease AprX